MNNNISYKAWLAFAAVAFFWGTTYFAIRVGVQSFPPMLMAGIRHSIGGILICLYFLLRGYKIPVLKDLKIYAINGFLMLVIGNGLVTWAEIYISSGLAALICSLTPIWVVILNSLTGKKEKITWMISVGLAICLMGQLLIFKDNLKDLTLPNYVFGIVAIIIANISWALGTIYSMNHHSNVHPLFGAGLQMIFGGVVLDLIGTWKGEWAILHPTSESIWALIYLIIFGSIIAYGAFMYVLKKMPASIFSTYPYINTLVAVVIGWLFLAEKLNFILGLAILLTIAGVWVVNKSTAKSSK